MEKAGRESDGAPCGPVLHIVVVGFHHKKGCQVRTGRRLLGAPRPPARCASGNCVTSSGGSGLEKEGRTSLLFPVNLHRPAGCLPVKEILRKNSAFERRHVVSCGFPHECSSRLTHL